MSEFDFYSRTNGTLGRSLRAVARYRRSHDHGPYGQARLNEAEEHIKEAMRKISAAHKAADGPPRGPDAIER